MAFQVAGYRRGVHFLGHGHFNYNSAAQFLISKRCFRGPRQQLHASPHYVQKWSSKFIGSLESKFFWKSTVYATVLVGFTSYFYVST